MRGGGAGPGRLTSDLVTLRLLSARDHALETLDEAARRDLVATTHRRVTYVDGPALDMVGTLRARTPDGSWFEPDEDDVSRILWPEATLTPSPSPTDAREIVYLALTRDRRVVRRTVLP